MHYVGNKILYNNFIFLKGGIFLASERIIADAIMSPVLRDFRSYKLLSQNRTPKTVDEYICDLRIFFKFIIANREDLPVLGDDFEKISLTPVNADFADGIKTSEIYDYQLYMRNDRGISARTLARKMSAIKSFYKYATVAVHICKNNPAKDIEGAFIRNSSPKFLTLEESAHLLDTINNDSKCCTRLRDYAIILLFLNTGLRLSELVMINIEDFDREMTRINVIGKGRKERVVYINPACKNAIIEYLEQRREIQCIERGKHPLFLSTRGKRISNNAVQKRVEKYLADAGFEYKKLSTHKLRHTAATLMYREGGVDVRVLQEILGHEQLNTTQIYTHVVNEDIERATMQNPLARYKPKPSE